MSAANFYKRNAENYYVIDCRSYYNQEGEQIEKWEYGCEIEDDTEYLLDDIYERERTENGWREPTEERDYTRGDCVLNICEKPITLELSPDCAVTMRACIVYRGGYYECGNLDWTIRAYDGHGCSFSGEYEPGDIEELITDCQDYVEYREELWNAGLIRMQAKNIARKVLEAYEKLAGEAEEFCKRNCTGVYALAYRFSNGEAGYTRIS